MSEVSADFFQELIDKTAHLSAKGAYAESRRVLRRFMQLQMEKKTNIELQLMLCDSYIAEGKWVKPLQLLGSLETEVLRDKNPETTAYIFNRIAYCLISKGDIAAAAKYYRRSLNLLHGKEIFDGVVANNISDLAYIVRLRGNYRKALSGYERVVQICEGISGKLGRTRALHNMARLKSLLLDTDAAIADANIAFSLASETGNNLLMIDCFWLLGLLLFEKGDIWDGLEHVKQAVQKSGHTGGVTLVRAYVAYVRILTRAGAFNEAKRCCEDALTTARRLKNNLGVAHCHLLLARIRLLQNDHVAALQYAQEAKAFFHSAADHVGKASALICKTEALIHGGQISRARKTLQTAVSIAKKTDDVVLKSDCKAIEASLLLERKKFEQSTAKGLQQFWKQLRHNHVHQYLKVGYHLAALMMIGGKLENVLGITQELLERSQTVVASLPEEYHDSYQNHPLVKAVIKLSLRARLENPRIVFSVEDTLNAVKALSRLADRKPQIQAKTRKSAAQLPELIYVSDNMREVVSSVEKIAPMDVPVLITGETGVGKEVIAQLIHYFSGRKGRFVPLNCSAMPLLLMETELFGYAKGAFTGAHANKDGLLLMANSGTFFLDEIGDMSSNMQVKMLRVLEEGLLRPVGSTKQIVVNTRFLSATNRDLKEEVEHGGFRQDLFYRINVITINIPPLRERRDDIVALVEHFLEKSGQNIRIDKIALGALVEYDWPGNVRELMNEILRLVSTHKGTIKKNMLKDEILMPQTQVLPSGSIQEMEHKLIEEMLKKTDYNKEKTAKLLGIAKSTLYGKMKRYKIDHTKPQRRSDIER